MKSVLMMVALLAITAAHAQEAVRPWMALENRIGIALGIANIAYLDKNSSPLVYESRPKNVRLFYNLESRHMLFSLDLDVKMGGTSARYHRKRTAFFSEEDYKGKREDKKFPVGGSFLAGRVSLGAYYKLRSTEQSTFRIAAGLRVSDEAFYPQGWTSAGLFNALSFAPEALAQHAAGEDHAFTATVRIPMVAYLTRPAYHNSVSYPGRNQVQGFFRNSEWTGAGKFLAPSVRLAYDYTMSSHWGAGLNYEFTWYNINVPAQMRAINQSLQMNIHHQF